MSPHGRCNRRALTDKTRLALSNRLITAVSMCFDFSGLVRNDANRVCLHGEGSVGEPLHGGQMLHP